jgi:Competence protein CoiA-like family
MPLTVLHGDQPVNSWDYHDLEDWQALRDNSQKVRQLHFPCCDSPVVLKVSSTAMPFFAHAPGRACAQTLEAERRESPEHQALKYAIAFHLSKIAGWTVRTEQPAPDRTWRADVLATHTSGRQLAVEPQLSRQSAEAFRHRSSRYLQAGIMPTWITTGLPTEVEMRRIAHFQISGRHLLRAHTTTILNTIGATIQWGPHEELTLADYLDRMASPDADWPWTLEATTNLRTPAPKRPVQWPEAGPPATTEAERIKAMYARLVAAAQIDQSTPET